MVDERDNHPSEGKRDTGLNTAAEHQREGQEQEEAGAEERELEERGAIQPRPDRIGADVPHSQKVSSDG